MLIFYAKRCLIVACVKSLQDLMDSPPIAGEHPVPSLLHQPGDRVVHKNENVTLECSASATLSRDEGGLASVNMTATWRRGPAKSVSFLVRALRRCVLCVNVNTENRGEPVDSHPDYTAGRGVSRVLHQLLAALRRRLRQQ